MPFRDFLFGTASIRITNPRENSTNDHEIKANVPAFTRPLLAGYGFSARLATQHKGKQPMSTPGRLSTRLIFSAYCLLLLVAVTAKGQHYQLRHYGISDGLAHGAVHSIYQDRKGYLWFATNEGLSRFDGYSFVSYGEREGLAQQLINDVAEDRQGRIWVATNGAGVALLIADTPNKSAKKFKTILLDHQSNKPGDIAKNSVNHLLIDSEDNLWALTDAGLFRASLRSEDLDFQAVSLGVIDSLNPMIIDKRGRLWVGSGKNLLEIRAGQLINHGGVGSVSQRAAVVGIVEDTDGRIMVANESGLYELVLATAERPREDWRRIEFALAPKQRISSLLIDSAGDLYVGTTSGLLKLRRDGQRSEIDRQRLGTYQVHSMAEDRDGDIWISTWANGVYKLGGEVMLNYTRKDGSNLATAEIVDDNGALKAVDFSGELFELANDKIEHSGELTYPPTIGYSVLISRDKQWWASSLGGHWAKFSKLVLRLRDGRDLPLTAIASIDELARGVAIYQDETGKIWINKGVCGNERGSGTILRADVTNFDHISFERFAADFRDLGYRVQMTSDGAGGIWMATSGRLCRLHSTLKCMQPSGGLPEIDPRSLFLDSRGWLWVGQRHKGVSMTKQPAVDNPTFVHYSTENGLLSDTAWAFTEDDGGKVYVGTGKGLNRFDPTNGTWQGFTASDGLAGDQIESFYKDRSGNIWIAGGGVTRLNPHAESKTTQAPPTYINRVTVAGEELPLPETGVTEIAAVLLTATHNNVSIDFVGLQFQGEDTLLYQHKLEGADADWSAPAKLRSVNYASLSPGSYRFLVRSINRGGLISVPATFTFRILSPIYLRWWFITLAALLCAVLAFSVYRYRLNRLLEIERVRTRIATDLHDDIGASLSRMAILSEAMKYQDEIKSGASTRMLSEIADSARSMIDAMADIVWSIDPKRDNLQSATARIRQFASDVLEARGIAWDLKLPPELEKVKLNADQRRQLLLIFKEAINNVVRHSGCSNVMLSLGLEGRLLAAEVRDDGCGFQSERFEGNSGNGRGGNGLKNMGERARQLGGEFQVLSSPGAGTRLIFKVPLG